MSTGCLALHTRLPSLRIRAHSRYSLRICALTNSPLSNPASLLIRNIVPAANAKAITPVVHSTHLLIPKVVEALIQARDGFLTQGAATSIHWYGARCSVVLQCTISCQQMSGALAQYPSFKFVCNTWWHNVQRQVWRIGARLYLCEFHLQCIRWRWRCKWFIRPRASERAVRFSPVEKVTFGTKHQNLLRFAYESYHSMYLKHTC